MNILVGRQSGLKKRMKSFNKTSNFVHFQPIPERLIACYWAMSIFSLLFFVGAPHTNK